MSNLLLEISVSVIGFTDTPAGHTVYNLSCRVAAEGGVGRKTFTVDRRFSEFQELHAEIQPLLPSIPSSFPVSKSVFSSEATKRDRVDKFQDYLRTAVSAAGPVPPPALLRFLNVDTSKVEEAVAAASRGESAAAPSRSQREPEPEPLASPFGVVSAPSSSDANEALRDGIKGDNTAECLRLLDVAHLLLGEARLEVGDDVRRGGASARVVRIHARVHRHCREHRHRWGWRSRRRLYGTCQ